MLFNEAPVMITQEQVSATFPVSGANLLRNDLQYHIGWKQVIHD